MKRIPIGECDRLSGASPSLDRSTISLSGDARGSREPGLVPVEAANRPSSIVAERVAKWVICVAAGGTSRFAACFAAKEICAFKRVVS